MCVNTMLRKKGISNYLREAVVVPHHTQSTQGQAVQYAEELQTPREISESTGKLIIKKRLNKTLLGNVSRLKPLLSKKNSKQTKV